MRICKPYMYCVPVPLLMAIWVGPAQAGFWDGIHKSLEGLSESFDAVKHSRVADSDQNSTTHYDAASTREIQQRLTALGFDPGPADGIYGSKTREAIKAFEHSRNMAARGEPTQSVISMLRAQSPELKMIAKQPFPSVPPQPTATPENAAGAAVQAEGQQLPQRGLQGMVPNGGTSAGPNSAGSTVCGSLNQTGCWHTLGRGGAGYEQLNQRKGAFR